MVPPVPQPLDYLGLRRPPRPPITADTTGDYGRSMARLHDDHYDDHPDSPNLTPEENIRFHRIRMLGTTGAVLMLVGALGTGQLPVLQNPLNGMRVLSLPSRMWTTALTVSIAGTVILVIAWLLIGRYAVGRLSVELAHGDAPVRRMTRRQADRTLLLWTLPIMVSPPLLSKDVYSYLAQSAIAEKGMNPYQVSPAAGLGIDHVFTRSVPSLWRDTPAPYGPLFLWIGEGITKITGTDIPAALVMHRVVALCGIGLIVWALPRLATRCGVSPVAALWLGAMNPLVVLHLIGGIHNEALMIGLMLAGIELCFRGIYGAERLRRPGSWRPTTGGWLIIAGAVVLAASTMVKVTSVLAFGFVAIALARRWGATLPALRHAPLREFWPRSKRSVYALLGAGGLLGSILAVVVVAVCVGTGLGFGWTKTLNTGDVVRSWMSLSTFMSVTGGHIGIALGLGDHTQAILDVARPLGTAIAAVLVIRWLLAALAGRLHPLGALGVAFASVVLFYPFVQPWYLLWALIPLAAWATGRWFRIISIAISAIISLAVLPTAAATRGYQISEALVAAVPIVAITMALFLERFRIRSGGDGPSDEPGGPEASRSARALLAEPLRRWRADKAAATRD
ncbi:polyprenol phosphomannose-dependent alpha 1,6 mannosyltransferase MptB [Jongsikchunia kroppenstedtii]|uniref:polyprenol phosphomannose-dependent alpha 1,6 mannosyltransferase MptB n=1 Tax=Jongsikchunia kroppenstedtii TaxID=1121721 RepID=UPI0005BA85E8